MTDQFDQPFWDDRYRSVSALWSGRPNPRLVSETVGLEPGAALDVGAGEGADAIWLASRGWRVTAVDLSPVALDRAGDHAESAGGVLAQRIDWQHRDITAWEPPAASYDLVSSQFIHLAPEARADAFRHMAAAVAPGGTLLVVGHALVEGAPVPPEFFFSGEDVALALDPGGWETVTDAVVERDLPGHGGAHHQDGAPVHTHDIVFRARRLPDR